MNINYEHEITYEKLNYHHRKESKILYSFIQIFTISSSRERLLILLNAVKIDRSFLPNILLLLLLSLN